MNHSHRNEESSLAGTAAPASANSRNGIEDLVANIFEHAPQTLDPTTPARSGLRARLVGGSGLRQQNITERSDRRRIVNADTLPSPPSEAQRMRFQIETETAEAEIRAEQLAILRLQMQTERAELDARKAAAEESLAGSRRRIDDMNRRTPSSSPPKSPARSSSSPRVRSPSPPLEIAALLHMFHAQQQQAADQRREDDLRREEQEQRREDQRRADDQRRENPTHATGLGSRPVHSLIRLARTTGRPITPAGRRARPGPGAAPAVGL